MTKRPEDYEPGNRVDYYQFDEAGRIVVTGVNTFGIIRDMIEAGERYGYGHPDYREMYVDMADRRTLKSRPALPGSGDRQMKARVLWTLPDLPPCEIAVSGLLSKVVVHAGGPFAIGFALPGVYLLRLEPFPFKPVLMNVEVTS